MHAGHDEIKKCWTRQWTEINPKCVDPVGFFYERLTGSDMKLHCSPNK